MSEHHNSSILSDLKLEHIVFDNISFVRKGFKSEAEEEVEIGLAIAIGKIKDGYYRVSLHVTADRNNEYEVEVDISCFCSIDEQLPFKQEVLEKNVVAILIPYVRAELSLLTAQPETTQILLPAINVDAMAKDSNDHI